MMVRMSLTCFTNVPAACIALWVLGEKSVVLKKESIAISCSLWTAVGMVATERRYFAVSMEANTSVLQSD